jgi:hypothetical protein
MTPACAGFLTSHAVMKYTYTAKQLTIEAKQLARAICRKDGIKLSRVDWSIEINSEALFPRLHVEYHGISKQQGLACGGTTSIAI